MNDIPDAEGKKPRKPRKKEVLPRKPYKPRKKETRPRKPYRIPKDTARRLAELRRGRILAMGDEERAAFAMMGAVERWKSRKGGAVIGRKWFRIGLAPDILEVVEERRGESTITDFLDGVLAKALKVKREGLP